MHIAHVLRHFFAWRGPNDEDIFSHDGLGYDKIILKFPFNGPVNGRFLDGKVDWIFFGWFPLCLTHRTRLKYDKKIFSNLPVNGPVDL